MDDPYNPLPTHKAVAPPYICAIWQSIILFFDIFVKFTVRISGWHIPSDEEWTTLTNYLISNGYEGSGDDIGKSMAAKSLWAYNSTPGNVGNDLAGNNSSGFSALPAGYRSNDENVEAVFVTLNWVCSWWSSTDLTDKIAWQRLMQNQFSNVTRSYFGGKRNGISVRCIKDQTK